jgi:hypothetical protein
MFVDIPKTPSKRKEKKSFEKFFKKLKTLLSKVDPLIPGSWIPGDLQNCYK